MRFLSSDYSIDTRGIQNSVLRLSRLSVTGAIVTICLMLGLGHAQAEEPVKSSATLPSDDAGRLPGESGAQGVTWIAQQPRSNYTVQLMVAATQQHLANYIRKESLTAPLAIAGFRKDDKVLHLLLQGSYATRTEADAAAAQFEGATGLRPWVRRFSALPELFDSHAVPLAVKPEPAKEPPPPVAGAAWLWSRNPLRYTVQLMGDSRSDTLLAFIQRHRPTGPLAIVRVGRGGKRHYLLLAGDYASEDAAARVIQALPSEMAAGHPSPRRFSVLQDQMVEANH